MRNVVPILADEIDRSTVVAVVPEEEMDRVQDLFDAAPDRHALPFSVGEPIPLIEDASSLTVQVRYTVRLAPDGSVLMKWSDAFLAPIEEIPLPTVNADKPGDGGVTAYAFPSYDEAYRAAVKFRSEH